MKLTVEMRMALAAIASGLDPAVFWNMPMKEVLTKFAEADAAAARRKLS